jgi:hypothetical protein
MPKKINPSKQMKRPVLLPKEVIRFMGKIRTHHKKIWRGSECWIWKGYTDENGYGQFKLNGKAVWAHRLSYAIFRGPIQEGMDIDHRCKNPSCCNPFHLCKKHPSINRATNGKAKTEKYDDDIPF